MNTEQCIEKGLLKKVAPDAGKAMLALEIAEKNLGDAEKQIKAGLPRWAFIAAYTAMFHAGRAILYRDGVKERSHYCIYIYLREKYSEKIEPKYFTELNLLREQRHRTMYGDEKVRLRKIEEEEAENAVETARGFLEVVRAELEK
ncbi:MAG: HEPN domain-containing protein [Candidatus Micrarchaeia archaeon]